MDKILKIQTEIGALAKDKKNPFFNSSYFDINQIISQLLPLLDKHQLCVTQPLVSNQITGKPALQTVVYDVEKKEILTNENIQLPEIDNPQKMGSAITYYRRYALQSLFLLQAEDDDANGASGKKKADKEDLPF